jgi:hypothetical protein
VAEGRTLPGERLATLVSIFCVYNYVAVAKQLRRNVIDLSSDLTPLDFLILGLFTRQRVFDIFRKLIGIKGKDH